MESGIQEAGLGSKVETQVIIAGSGGWGTCCMGWDFLFKRVLMQLVQNFHLEVYVLVSPLTSTLPGCLVWFLMNNIT